MNGLSGQIKFDHEGFRTSVEMQIIELREEGIVERGIWDSFSGVKTKMIPDPHQEPKENDLANTTLDIVISLVRILLFSIFIRTVSVVICKQYSYTLIFFIPSTDETVRYAQEFS